MVDFVKSKTIEYGLHALIRLPSNSLKIIEISKGGIINLGKFGIFEIEGIIGFKYGQSFEVLDDKKVRPIKGNAYGIDDGTENEIIENDSSEETGGESKESTPFPETLSEKINYLKKFENSETNKHLLDIGSKTQSLTMEEIETLKRQGNGANIGESIIDKLIKSHANFDKKTKHSQEKYLRRKQQKFLRKFTVEYVTSSNLLNYFIEKDVAKVLDLSEESLGLLINLGNIQPGGRYLVIDETGGIILSSMLERMGGKGEILVLHENEHANHSALTHIDIPTDIIKTINVLQFFEPEQERIEWNDLSEQELKEMKSSKKAHYYRRKQNAVDTNSSIDNANKGNFDGLVIASTLYLPSLLDRLIEKVGGSRPIIIYNQFKEPLIELQIQSMNDLNLLAPTLHESKCRPYQTIPGRLHPLMSMRGGGGYVYSALRVLPIEKGVVAVGRGLKKRRVEEERS